MLGEVSWDAQTGWPRIQPQGERAETKKNFRDDFSGADLSYAWQWDFRNSQPHWKMEKGNLYLSGKTTGNNSTGTVLTVRPLTGDYEISTEVIHHNASLKGLVLYGDAGQAVGIGVQNSTIQVWEVKSNKRRVVAQQPLGSNKPLRLRMKVEKGY